MPLGSLLASLLEPVWRLNRAKFGLKRVLNAYLLQTVYFPKNERRVGHSTILTPRRHPRRAKIVPRRLQDLPKTILKSVFSLLKIAFDFDSFWDRFWLHFGSPNASLLAPFSHQNRSQNPCEIGLLQKSLQDRPKSAQDPPKTPPGPPRTAPGPPKTPPKPPPDAPRCPLGPPRTTQNAFPNLLAQ